ncbi:hypothetical protein [Helicobacter turcicus]|uniref:Uncharacterized protein n=1 Tax=Helicobacter turcicus TaxID=2867412 RepID=A0ABS7JQ63_9HELI|nr:hypothetical protein [Helicobacter turcicus]MBX7491549.1 hypothetical protein [Helicobacter turcicus]MBX7546402.1 hypothetical protein [Helicobacter turcicus]
MLKHCIIYSVDKKSSLNFQLLKQKELMITIIFSQEFLLKDSEVYVEQFGKEIVKKSKIKNIEEGENIPLSLHQLSLIDFNQFDSYHLVGDDKQFYFFTQIINKLGLDRVKIYFSNIDERENTKSTENILNIENLNNAEKIKNYISYILKNTKQKTQTCKKYHINTDATMIIARDCFSALYIENEQIISSYLEAPQTKIIKSKKLKKLKEKPFLFFKDFIINRMRKIKHRSK